MDNDALITSLRARIAALEAIVAMLDTQIRQNGERIARATTAEAVLRRAAWPDPQPVWEKPAHARDRHGMHLVRGTTAAAVGGGLLRWVARAGTHKGAVLAGMVIAAGAATTAATVAPSIAPPPVVVAAPAEHHHRLGDGAEPGLRVRVDVDSTRRHRDRADTPDPASTPVPSPTPTVPLPAPSPVPPTPMPPASSPPPAGWW